MEKYNFFFVLALCVAISHASVMKRGAATQATITTCGGVIEGDSGTIEYSLDAPYGSNERCIWTIRVSPAATQVELTKVTSGFETGFDYLTAHGFSTREGLKQTTIIGRSTNLEEQVIMNGTVVILQFSSDHSNPGTGFRLNFRAAGQANDLIRVSNDMNTGETSGSIDFPEDNGFYPNYDLSTYVISTNYTWGQGNIQLTLDAYSLENSSGCVYDGLVIYSVTKDTARQIGKFCGASNGPIVLEPATALILVFFSDDSNAGSGFEASWVPAS